jgi:hypothetical protein
MHCRIDIPDFPINNVSLFNVRKCISAYQSGIKGVFFSHLKGHIMFAGPRLDGDGKDMPDFSP